MSTYDALLRAVLENPAEDLPRLVLADWHDDQGEHLRAEFIRLQIAQANAVKCPLAAGAFGIRGCVCDRCRLEREIDKLMRSGRQWASDYGPGDKVYMPPDGWTRGFVSAVGLPVENMYILAPQVFSRQPV